MCFSGAPVSGVKPEHPGHNFDYEHAYSQVKTVTLQAKNVQPKTNYCAGVLRNGQRTTRRTEKRSRKRPALV